MITARELANHYRGARKEQPQRLLSIKHENPAEIYATAMKYGANVTGILAHTQAWDCWADRIAWLPVAAGRSPSALASAVDEANRYA
jgi:hypothetical protein